ncbi:hypothetical protein Lal_00024382 [Lupinus albus]|nr:hypothetical protein Lal_00024382 [Lupinus albus]
MVGFGQPDFHREVGLGRRDMVQQFSVLGNPTSIGKSVWAEATWKTHGRVGRHFDDTWQHMATHGSMSVWANQTSNGKSVWPTKTSMRGRLLLHLAQAIFYSSNALHEPSKDVIRMRHVNNFDEEPLLNDILQLTGFSKLSSLRSFNIDPYLITALVERWRPETHTFHLPHGECTITLEDVSLQIGVNVNGLPLAGPTYFDWNEICEELLGKVPSDEQDMRGCELKLTWLFDNFETLPPRPTQLQKEQFCRARILYMIGGELLPDKSNNRVHLMYLPLLRDLTRVHRYSWGSACLANLYREMCRATKPNAKAMGGCLTLLQSWAWYRLPFLAPIVNRLPTYPFASRWGQRNLSYRGIPRGDLIAYRSRLDRMDVNDFQWLPYENYVDNLPREVLEDKNIWSACTALICFSIVEWHQTDRVRLQFKLLQDLPQPPQNLDALHRVDKREAQLRDPRQINYQQNQPPTYQQPTYQQPIYQQSQPPIYNRNQQQPYYTNLAPIPPTSMFQPTMNPPIMSQNLWYQPTMSASFNIQPGRMSFHEPSQHHRSDDMMPSRHSFSTDHNDFMNNLLGTPDSANQLFSDIGYNLNQDSAGPSSFMVDTNIFPTGQTDTVPDQTPTEVRRTRRNRQPRRCGTGGHLGNH